MSEQSVTRREFILRSGKATGFAAAAVAAGWMLHEPERYPFREIEDETIQRDLRVPGLEAELAVGHGADPAAVTAAVIAALGGMQNFISPGDKVIVKPNVGWDRRPEQAANTNPDVVAEVVRHCVAAGAAKVIVTDITCNDAVRSFNRSGIGAAAREAGAEVVMPSDARLRDVNMGGVMLGRQRVFDLYLEADKCINIPIAKHHSLTRVSLALKNLYGIIGGNRSRLHQDIHNSVADLGNFLRATLTIVDAWRILLRNGPQGGSLDDVEERHTIAACIDPVAIDAWAGAEFFNLAVDDMPWLALAERHGLGISDYAAIPYLDVLV
jgi:uncharacterized protein (DUF362 family)